MILEELIQKVQSLYSKGAQSRASRLTPRHIYGKMLTVRAKIFVQKINKKQLISNWDYQTLPCVEFIKVSVHECPCLPANFPMNRCGIYRSKHKIPRILTAHGRHMIKSLSTVDGATHYPGITFEEQAYRAYSKYTGTLSSYYVKDGYIWLTYNRMEDNNNNNLTVLTLDALFQDPMEAANFESYCITQDGDCLGALEQDFPIDYADVELIVNMTVQELLGVFVNNREDITNNSIDNGSK